jgi:hypothetical protein
MKPRTIFVDVDGCIFKSECQGTSYQWYNLQPQVLPGVLERFNAWEAEGACIIIVTARKEVLRHILETQLRNAGLFWDQIVMGITSGTRVLINDAKPDSEPSAMAYTIDRNKGLGELP